MRLPKAIDLTGQRFERLTVIDRSGVDKSGKITWRCRCDCGNETIASGDNLRRNHTRSCGCLMRETFATLTHGNARVGKMTTEYEIWQSMKKRCLNPKAVAYKWYGARGITIAPEWVDDFLAFRAYVGERPGKDLTLDRIDNDGNYEPGNVRWATRSEQQRNKLTQQPKGRNGRFTRTTA